VANFALHVAMPADVEESSGTEHFYWAAESQGSFISKVGAVQLDPNLGALGPVAELNVDAVRLALAICAADRCVKRQFGGSNWNSRDFNVQVAVSSATQWAAVTPELEDLVGFLTGDRWSFSFVEEAVAPGSVAMHTSKFKRVVLLSGGADSVVGAMDTRTELAPSDPYALVSHFSQTSIAPGQKTLAETLERLIQGSLQEQFRIHLNRKSKRPDGTPYSNEPSSRSRSLLFLTLGLAVASVDGVPLWIPENGFASLNPPLGRDRLGSLSTRTTHPAFLGGLRDVLGAVGAHNELHNPFASLTKGQMFAHVRDSLGTAEASKLLSLTNSCAHTGHPGPRSSSSVACGVCFGCVMRRASFVAAGLDDQSTYADPAASAEMKAWIDNKSVLPSVRSFVARGVRTKDLLAMSLPESYSLDDAAELCARGVDELARYLDA